MGISHPFVSYAQHGEDVILWRALGGRTGVFYVDVGAFDPTYDSVTRALYERGWHGINIEPQPDRVQAFDRERPLDTTLSLAVGDRDGTATLWIPTNAGWATTHEHPGGHDHLAGTLTVPMRRLDTLLPEHGRTRVDVLKIDVAGGEAGVVRGLLPGTVRPLVCVVAGLTPSGDRRGGDETVALLVAAGYVHCLFDGLNHYLTTDLALRSALSVPASPADRYTTDLQARLSAEREENHATIAALAAENLALRGLGDARPAAPRPPVHDAESDLVATARAVALTADAGGPGRRKPTGISTGRVPRPRVATADLTPRDLDPVSRLARRRAMVVRLLRGAPNTAPRNRTSDLTPSVLELALVDRPPGAAVCILYRAILGRAPEPEGLATWTAHADAGMPLFDVACNLARSDEALRQPVQRRARVQTDLAAWSSLRAALELGIAGRQLRMTYRDGAVAHEILVNALFEVGLGREPQPDEAAREVARLVAGVGRERMVRGFAQNPETRRRLLGEPSGGVLHRVRRRWTGRQHVDTFRALVAASEDRQIGQILATLAVAQPRIQELTAGLVGTTGEV